MSEEEETKKKKNPETIGDQTRPEPQIWSMLGAYYGDTQSSISYITSPPPTETPVEKSEF